MFDPTTDTIETLPASANRDLPMYPRLYVVPSGPLKGRVFFQPGGCLWCPGGTEDGEAMWNYAASFDPATNEWEQHDLTVLGVRNAPVSVLLALRPPAYEAKILTATGTLNRMGLATPLTEITDLSVDPPTHTLSDPMTDARWFANHVLLPDGNVVVVGGARQDGVLLMGSDSNDVAPVRSTELFSPETGLWSTLAPMSVPRVYHSTALLLPDGRVWVAGSVPGVVSNPVAPGQHETAIEIFEPPYLFRGDRPVIESAPRHVGWDAEMTIRTPDAAVVTPVLVRTGTVTHVNNPEQRLIELVVKERADGALVAISPPDAALAPPGYYMLFLMKDTKDGPVPSVSTMVHIA